MMKSLLSFLGIKRESNIYIENDSIYFRNPYMYSDKQDLITEIPLSHIKEISVISQDLDIAISEHKIILELFNDSFLKDFIIFNRRERRFAKELFEALKIDFDTKHFLSRNELFLVVYPEVKSNKICLENRYNV